MHRYDDIDEADNPLPRWWLVTFFGTIIFAVGYFYYYQVFAVGPTPQEELANEIAAVEKKSGGGGIPKPEELVALSKDDKAVGEGRQIFVQMCSPCHGENAEGKIGPNLTDKFWLHGGRPEEIYKTVSEGVTAKGMPTWGPTLGPVKMSRVVAYVVSLHGKNVPGKAPDGVEESDGAPAPAASEKGKLGLNP